MKAADQERLRRANLRRIMGEGIAEFRRAIGALVPDDFAWAVSMDCETMVTVKWRWTGHPRVTHYGQCRDQDPGIVVSLLESVDWKEELEAAFKSVEEAEAALLSAAQERRRLRLLGGAPALPEAAPVALLPGPADDIPARRTRSVEFAARLAAVGQIDREEVPDVRAEFAARLRATREAGQALVLGKYETASMEEAGGRMPGRWCLSVDRHRMPTRTIRWVSFDTFPDMLAAIAAEPPFTWRAAWLGRQSPTIYCAGTINALAEHLRGRNRVQNS